jgi:hypothetical protein
MIPPEMMAAAADKISDKIPGPKDFALAGYKLYSDWRDRKDRLHNSQVAEGLQNRGLDLQALSLQNSKTQANRGAGMDALGYLSGQRETARAGSRTRLRNQFLFGV